MMLPITITSKMKMADLLLANHHLVLLLPHFGIALGFGEKSVEEVCHIYQVSIPFFIMVCNIYTHKDYLPIKEEINAQNLQGMIPYLLASHRYYLKVRIPHIERHLQNISNACEQKHSIILMQFFAGYKTEVEKHFNYEEQVVYPYIKALIENNPPKNYCIHKYEENHDDIEEKLSDLTNIIIKYIPSDVFPKEKTSVLFDIFQLALDLNKHSLIEDKILIPYVESIEKEIR